MQSAVRRCVHPVYRVCYASTTQLHRIWVHGCHFWVSRVTMVCVSTSTLSLVLLVAGASGAELVLQDSSGSACKMKKAGDAVTSTCDLKIGDTSLVSLDLSLG